MAGETLERCPGIPRRDRQLAGSSFGVEPPVLRAGHCDEQVQVVNGAKMRGDERDYPLGEGEITQLLKRPAAEPALSSVHYCSRHVSLLRGPTSLGAV